LEEQYLRNSNGGNGYQGHLKGGHFPGFLLEGNYSLSMSILPMQQKFQRVEGKPQGCNYHLKIWREKSNTKGASRQEETEELNWFS